MNRKLGMALVPLMLVLGAAAGHATATARHPTTLTGHDWSAFESAEREAYLAGFAAGAAAQQASQGRATAPGRRVAADVQRLRTAGELAFPFTPNVYAASLQDYFFYRDRRDQTLIEAMVELNALKKRGGR